MIWPLAAAAVLVLNTVLSWSDAVAAWLGRSSDSETSSLPAWLVNLINSRPDVGDAEVHLVMWAVAGFTLAMAVRTPRRLAVGLGAVWVWSLVLEALQPVVTDLRGAQWLDAVGNTLGLALGASVVLVWRYRARVFPLPGWARWAVVAAVLAFVAYSMWSLSVMEWWAEVSSAEENPLVQLRPETNEADLHAVLWFTISLLVVWAARRRWAVALVFVFVVSWLIEWAQPAFSYRRYNTLDVVGNALGVGAAAVVTLVVLRWRRRGAARSAEPDGGPGGEHAPADAHPLQRAEPGR